MINNQLAALCEEIKSHLEQNTQISEIPELAEKTLDQLKEKICKCFEDKIKPYHEELKNRVDNLKSEMDKLVSYIEENLFKDNAKKCEDLLNELKEFYTKIAKLTHNTAVEMSACSNKIVADYPFLKSTINAMNSTFSQELLYFVTERANYKSIFLTFVTKFAASLGINYVIAFIATLGFAIMETGGITLVGFSALAGTSAIVAGGVVLGAAALAFALVGLLLLVRKISRIGTSKSDVLKENNKAQIEAIKKIQEDLSSYFARLREEVSDKYITEQLGETLKSYVDSLIKRYRDSPREIHALMDKVNLK